MKTYRRNGRSSRAARPSLALLLVLLLLPAILPGAAAAPSAQWRVPGPATKLYIGHIARLTAQIPSYWTPGLTDYVDFAGPDGFVASGAVHGSSIDDACAQVMGPDTSGATISMSRWQGLPACLITSPAEPSRGHPAESGIVVAHPHPFSFLGDTYAYAALFTDPTHFPAILATLSFSPDRVTPLAYATSVIDMAEAHALHGDTVDWASIRRSAARTVHDWTSARAAINQLATLLDIAGNPAQFVLPEDLRSGVYQVGTIPPAGHPLPGNIGYLSIEAMGPGLAQSSDYLHTVRATIARIEQNPTCGWIVDLRYNDIGDAYTMIQSLGPLLGDGRVFGFKEAHGRDIWIEVRAGAVYENGVEIIPAVADVPPSPPRRQVGPIAVLIGPSTKYSGELLAMAFVGRPSARLFGSPTAGDTEADRSFTLFDGSVFSLLSAFEMDRTGHVYTFPERVTPDQQTEEISGVSPKYGTEDDPSVNAAMAWLGQQPACQAMTADATPAA